MLLFRLSLIFRFIGPPCPPHLQPENALHLAQSLSHPRPSNPEANVTALPTSTIAQSSSSVSTFWELMDQRFLELSRSRAKAFQVGEIDYTARLDRFLGLTSPFTDSDDDTSDGVGVDAEMSPVRRNPDVVVDESTESRTESSIRRFREVVDVHDHKCEIDRNCASPIQR